MKEFIRKHWHHLVMALFCLTPVIWFIGRGNVLIDGVDTNFPLNPSVWFQRRLFVWNNVSDAGMNFSSSLAGIFFHLIQLIPFALGLPLRLVELISLVFWFSLIVVSGFIFAKAIVPRSKIAQVAMVCFYSFNTYLFNTWENVKVANIALVVGLPLVLSLYLFSRQRKILLGKLMLLSSIVGIIVSGSGINPAYFFVILLGLFVVFFVDFLFSIFKKNGVKQSIFTFAVILSALLLVNSFWIFPTVNHLLFSSKKLTSLSDIGFTNWLDSLSANTNLFNVLRLQGAWDWYAFNEAGAPLYIPYALNYMNRTPFIIFSLIIPELAILALILRDRERAREYSFFSLLFLLGVFFGAGSNPPTGTVFIFLTKHIPFFSFFRSPWYIFTPLLIVAYSGLIALFFDFVSSKKIKVSFLILTVFVTGNLLYNYPLVTGKIFRPDIKDRFYVSFPDYVFDASANLPKGNGRIVGYPDDEIERFDWGYNGIESILNLFSPEETLFLSLNDPNGSFGMVIHKFYTELKRNKFDSVVNIAGKLNIERIFLKQDQSSLAPDLSDKFTGLDTQSFGKWMFYSLPQEDFVPKIYSSTSAYFVYPFEKASETLGLISGREVVVSPSDTVVKSSTAIVSSARDLVIAQNSQKTELDNYMHLSDRQSESLRPRDLSSVTYSFEVPISGKFQPILENTKLSDFGIDASNGITVELDGKTTFWRTVDFGDYIYFSPIELRSGAHVAKLSLRNNTLITGGDFEGDRNFDVVGGEYEIVNQDDNHYLSLMSEQDQETVAKFSVPEFDGVMPYVIEFDYKYVYGEHPLLRVRQRNSSADLKIQREKPPLSPEWGHFSFYFDPVFTKSSLSLNLVAEKIENDSLGTKALFDNISIRRVFTNNMFFIQSPNAPLSSPDVDFEKLSPVRYQATINNANAPHVIVFSENYSPDWEMRVMNMNKEKILVEPKHFSTNLYANAWYLEDTPVNYVVEIYYKPQRIYYIGLTFSASALVGSGAFYFWSKRKEKHVKKK